MKPAHYRQDSSPVQITVLKVGGIYFIITEGLVSALHMRECHPQGFQLSAARQQFSLQMVLLSLDPLRLRLQTGQLHCTREHKQGCLMFLLEDQSLHRQYNQRCDY